MKKISFLAVLFLIFNTANSQTVTTYSSGYTNLEGIAINSDNVVHVSENYSGKIYKINSDASKTLLGTAGGYANDMVFDSSNNLYIAEPFISTISVINGTTGIKSEYKSTFTAGKSPYGLAMYNNLLYFSAESSSKVVRINADLTTTDIAANLLIPEGIAFDKNGNLYVADRNDRTLLMITPSGVVSTVASGIPNIRGVAVSNAGKVYFTSYDTYPVSNKILKYDPITGLVTDYVTTVLNKPRSIEIDKIGNMYVTNLGDGTVSKITDAGLLAVKNVTTLGELSIYPNPASKILNVNSNVAVTNLTVYTITGQKLIESTKTSVDVERLPKGVYLIKIEDKNKNATTRKFMKK